MSNKSKAGSLMAFEYTVIYFFLMAFLVIADQLVKRYIDFTMEYQSTVPVIDGFFSLHYVRNTGSAFSFLADKSWGITVLSAISAVLGLMVVVLMVISCFKHLKLLGFAFSLIAAGAFGNLIDRVWLKYVIDYLRFDFGSYTFPIFNLADICAVVGTFILLGIILFGHKYLDASWGSSDKKKVKEKARKAEVSMPEQEENTESEEDTASGDLEEEGEDEAESEEETLSIPYKTRPVNFGNSDDED